MTNTDIQLPFPFYQRLRTNSLARRQDVRQIQPSREKHPRLPPSDPTYEVSPRASCHATPLVGLNLQAEKMRWLKGATTCDLYIEGFASKKVHCLSSEE